MQHEQQSASEDSYELIGSLNADEIDLLSQKLESEDPDSASIDALTRDFKRLPNSDPTRAWVVYERLARSRSPESRQLVAESLRELAVGVQDDPGATEESRFARMQDLSILWVGLMRDADNVTSELAADALIMSLRAGTLDNNLAADIANELHMLVSRNARLSNQ
ncbi:hypothetical protein [Nakamurella multipartita]|uniref:hypothetical protein n=1 Tax=Nakamurella multipartita TaxID=53461 RepID=UPI0010FE4C85|nr:hypothetical protein [Nakamurella multipartita]